MKKNVCTLSVKKTIVNCDLLLETRLFNYILNILRITVVQCLFEEFDLFAIT